ncbi:MAG: VOC family protein [Lachnospiraceae bacterium]|nr:VOC family protein [Lachnospiraceae bacterium]
MITGIHHIALKCKSQEEYEKAKVFYTEVLGLTVKREWDAGIMIDTGAGLMEIFATGGDDRGQGVIRHFALATDDADDIVARVKAAGYNVFMGPADIVIQSDPPFPARIAFCFGPIGEEIEFFCER